MQTHVSLFRGWAWLLLVAALTGCAAIHNTLDSRVETQHPLMYHGGDAPYATVYFLRPWTERAMGFADNTLNVDLDGLPLVHMNKGEYTVVRLHPRVRTVMTLRNQTEVGPNWSVKEMTKDYEYSFAAGGSYFVILEPVDGEFRGVHFSPRNVDLHTAKEAAQPLRAVGMATEMPLSNL